MDVYIRYVKINFVRNPEQTLFFNVPQRWKISLPFILALASIIFLIWSGFYDLQHPHDGIVNLDPSGVIREIDPSGPTYEKLIVGDIIVSIDSVSVNDALPLYFGKKPGDEVELVVDREGELTRIQFRLAELPRSIIISELVVIMIALIFWGIGVGVQALKPAKQGTTLAFLFFQVSAMLLAAGLVSGIGPQWVSGLFNFLIWIIGPLAVHFHLYFPQRTEIKGQRVFLIFLYTIAILGGLPYLILGPAAVRSNEWFSLYLTISRLFLAFNLIIVVVLLVYSYRHTTTPGVRGKIRIVVLGGILSALPLVILTFLPDAILKTTLVPYSFAFLFLAIVPLTYGYAIFRHRLIEVEQHVNRGATYILVFSILGGFLLILYAILERWADVSVADSPLIITLLVLLIASIFAPLHRLIQRFVDSIFYGGWYDYRSAVIQISQGLEQITELPELAQTVSDRLVKTLQLEDTCVFLRDFDGDFSVIEVSPPESVQSDRISSFPVLPKSSLTFLLKIGAVEKSSLSNALSETTLSPEEHELLDSEQVHLWVPIIGHGQILGLLALGPKYGGDIFSGEDMDILRVVSRQISPIIENIHLLNQLRQYASELETRVEERTAELHDAIERVEAILANVGDGVFVTNLEGEILTANVAFEQQSGYIAEEVKGHTLYNLFGNHNDTVVIDDLKATLPKGEIWMGELIAEQKSGSPYDIQLTIAPVRDQSGQMVSYVGSQRDITRQKELDRLKDQLIFDVSHELRTPVTNLNMYLELLDGCRPEKRSGYLEVLKGETGRLIDLIESILDLSRLDIYKTKKVKFSDVNINLVAAQVVDVHRPLAESAGIKLTYQLDTSIPNIRGEQNQLARLVTNLLSNAIRYTPEGSVELKTFKDGDCACLQVIDTGIGIDEEDKPHLFDRFYRGRKVSQSRITGTGLGLAIVREIVEIHEGKIDVINGLNGGSVFSVWLPIE
jgi:PAS domain S-box-containing protein